MSDWADDDAWPDYSDCGKQVEIVKLAVDGGQTIRGELFLEDCYFDGEDELPGFALRLDDGTTVVFAAHEKWRFV